ncbi:YfbM family protein [Agrococcus sp. HG114]|uniref:YfbM family protein n=1 Tax=Agrococcus sp. HG114 TaxID=2969757 RepID=UPI00215A742E|nr:YfbM family protein [Agrococcus sp. HG114]MCR8669592.1 YfbM family protein [Agrococcus sp. HG114]
MGIRYYAYAFDRPMTQQALADPRSFIAGDPLADAWGFEPGAQIASPSFEQSVPKRDMLYLDKAWSMLQRLTGPGSGDGDVRPAYRMFEGHVTDREGGWEPWVRALPPDEVPAIARDLAGIDDAEARARLRESGRFGGEPDAEADYAMHYLDAARAFVSALATEGRGMAYLIG